MQKDYTGSIPRYNPIKTVTVEQYRSLYPIKATNYRNKIYLQPMGNFDSTERKLIQYTSNYLDAFYLLETIILPPISDSLPSKQTRNSYMSVFTCKTINSSTTCEWHDTATVQLNTTHILYSILKPRLPDDAAAVLAICRKDLYPNEQKNFVFGIASLSERVGIFSLARLGNIRNPFQFNEVLMRALKVACHETAHMFSINHCSKYHCVMNGANKLIGIDGKPTWLCPDCLEKFCWNFRMNAIAHLTKLKIFWQDLEIQQEVDACKKFIRVLEK